MSNRRNLTSTMSPRRRDVTSCRRRSRSSASISSTINSTCSSVTCCLAHALASPPLTLSRAAGSLPPPPTPPSPPVPCCLPHALASPLLNFSRSNGSLPPSLFMTMSRKGSRRSYVVNLFSHERHSRRRRTASFVSESRESMTFVSSKSQYGHCILTTPVTPTPYLVPRKPSTPHFPNATGPKYTLTSG